MRVKTQTTPKTVRAKQANTRLLQLWENYMKTGQLDIPRFAETFFRVVHRGLAPEKPRAHRDRSILDHWSEFFIQREIREALFQHLTLESAETFLEKLIPSLQSLTASDMPRVQRWVGELLFTFKHSRWREKIYQAQRVNRWFQLYLQLIHVGKFNTGALLRTWSQHYSEDVAFQYTIAERSFHLSWEELWERILRIGEAIRLYSTQEGILPRVAILSENRIEGVLTDLACLTFGFVNVMIPANSAPDNIAFILEDAEANILFVSNENLLHNLFPHISHLKHLRKIILFDRPGAEGDPRVNFLGNFIQEAPLPEEAALDEMLSAISPEDLATIMYTSGTTGKSKGIMFSHQNIVSKRFARALAWPSVGEQDMFISYLPLYHTFGRWLEMMGSLFWGAVYLFARSPSTNSLMHEMQVHHPSIFISIPQKWQQIYEFVGTQVDLDRASDEEVRTTLHYYTGGHLRMGLSAAGYLDPDIFKFFQRNGVELMSGFGMTEATGGITMTPWGRYKENSLGTALPGIELKLAPDGELLIRGPYVMMGYWKSPEPSFDEDGWFHTGDIMRQDADGYFYIIDRKKEIYKNIKGQTVAPQRIENFFRDIDAIQRVFLVGDHREYNTLLIYPNYDHKEVNLRAMSPEELHEFLSSIVISVNKFLAPYERIVNFAVIERDFSQELGELTPKKTFRRKVIEEHFRDVIEKMYQSNAVQLEYGEKRIIFPNWLLRELGILAHEVQISPEDRILIQGIPVVDLEIDPRDSERIRIGNLWYRVNGRNVNIGDILSRPNLWLTNQQLVELTHEKIFQWNRIKQEEPNIAIDFEKKPTCYKKALIWEAFRLIRDSHIRNLRALHISGLVVKFGDEKQASDAVEFLGEMVTNAMDPLRPHTIQMLNWAVMNPSRKVKRLAFLKLYRHIPEAQWIQVFHHFLEADASFFDDSVRKELCRWDLSDAIFNQILTLAEELVAREAREKAQKLSTKVNTLILFLRDFATLRPTKYRIIRRFFTTYSVENVNRPLQKSLQRAMESMERTFREWLGPNSPVAIDPDLSKEYSWKDVIVFDDNVPDQHIYLLQELISRTPFIREALFLFTNHLIVNLKDLPPGGIWITALHQHHGKAVYRISVQTRYQGRYDITANVVTNLSEEEVREELAWSIICSEKAPQPKLVEEFGGYWPEYHVWSEEFIPGETVADFYQRMTRQGGEERLRRITFLWPYIIWSSCKAYVDFWNRTGKRYEIADPGPENVIVPHHDYQTGTRIISITARKPHRSLAEAIMNYYQHFIQPMLDKYPFLKKTTRWQFIFSPVLEILGEEAGIHMLEEMLRKDTSQQLPADLKREAQEYLESIRRQGFMPKQLYFAKKRFERWKQVNPEATTEADAATVQELYDTYGLHAMEKKYPETRVRFYRETVFRQASDALKQQLDQLINLLKKHKLRGDDLVQYITQMQTNLQIEDWEKYLLTRMTYAHLRASDIAELMTMDTGEKTTAALVVTFLDKEGEQIRVRNPINPKEVAALHRMFHQSNLPVSFEPRDQFLLAFNQRDQLVGGLFYHIHENDTVHLEKIVVASHYRRKRVSEGLLNEFFNRMRSLGYKRVRTGFFRPEFFYRFGFRIEKGYPGLVKMLVEEEK